MKIAVVYYNAHYLNDKKVHAVVGCFLTNNQTAFSLQQKYYPSYFWERAAALPTLSVSNIAREYLDG